MSSFLREQDAISPYANHGRCGILVPRCELGFWICGRVRYRLVRGSQNILYFPASVFKSVPVSVFLPVFIVIFHLDYFVYPMLWLPVWAMVTVNIANSVLEMPRERVVQRRLLELRVWPYLRDIVFWETLDSLFATVRIAAPFCLTLQVALDYFLDVNDGLGAFIKTSNEGLQYVQMHAGALVVCFLGFGLLVGTDELSARYRNGESRR